MPVPTHTMNAWLEANAQPLAFGLGGFSSAILVTLFHLFSVVVFSDVVQLKRSVFYTGHFLYVH